MTTGANQGLGLAIIQVIAQRSPPSCQILACRGIAFGENALQQRRDRGMKCENEILQLGFTYDDQIDKAVKHVKSRYNCLDGTVHD